MSTKTRFSSVSRVTRAEGLIFLMLLLLSFFMMGLVNKTGQENQIDPTSTASLKLGEELSIAMHLHESPQMAKALSPVLDVPVRLFSDTRTEVIIKFDQKLVPEDIRELEGNEVTFQRMEGQIVHISTIYPVNVPWSRILDVAGRQDVLKIEWGFKKYYPTLERSVPEIGADLVHKGIGLDQALSGEGITIGMVDTGVYWEHPLFWKPDLDYKYRIVAHNGLLYADIDKSGDYTETDKSIHFIGPTGAIAEYLELDGSKFDFGYDYILLGGPDLNPPENKPSPTKAWSGSFWAIPTDENGNQQLEEGETVIGLFNCKIRAFFNSSEGKEAKRQEDGWFHADSHLFGDPAGHGTHVTAIGVGGQLGYSKYTGVAPGADIVMSSTTWYLEDMIQELNWVIRQGVDVINLSFGSLFDGALDGSSLFEQIIDNMCTEQGVLTTVSAGNSNEDPVHVMGEIPGGQTRTYRFITFDPTSAKLRVYFPDHPSGSYFLINAVWKGEADLSFQVITPTGQIPLGKYSSPGTGLNPVLNATWSAASNFDQIEKRMSRFYAPVMQNITLGDPKVGTGFVVEVTNLSPEDVKVHLYLSGDVGNTGPLLSHWEETEPALQTGYLVNSPATADRAIAVTSYVSLEWDDASGGPNAYKSNLVGEISKYASQGPRVDETIKPNIAAPGELIISAASRDAYYDVSTADLTGIGGTSQATPHVSGTIALLLEAIPEVKKSPDIIFNALYENVNLVDVEEPLPNSIWGSGKLNTYKVVLSLVGGGTGTYSPPTETTEPGVFVPGFELIVTFSTLVVTVSLLKKKRNRS